MILTDKSGIPRERARSRPKTPSGPDVNAFSHLLSNLSSQRGNVRVRMWRVR
jgi:hypothetical protein